MLDHGNNRKASKIRKTEKKEDGNENGETTSNHTLTLHYQKPRIEEEDSCYKIAPHNS